MSKTKAKNESTIRTQESKTYQTMLEEVESIVRNISGGPMDLDEVVTNVEQGYKLITQMRERLDATKVKVEKLRTDFEAQKTSDTANVSSNKKKAAASKVIDQDDDSEELDDSEQDDDDSPF